MAQPVHGEHTSIARLRELCAAFLLATVTIAIFSFIGIRGAQREVNEQLMESLQTSQDLILEINNLEFQLSLAERDLDAYGRAPQLTGTLCKRMMLSIEKKFARLESSAGDLTKQFREYPEFVSIQHEAHVQVIVLEMECTPYTVSSAQDTIRRFGDMALLINKRLNERASRRVKSSTNLGMVSLGLIAAIFALLVAFALPILVLPRDPVPKKANNVYYLPPNDASRGNRRSSK